jgi:hypothetical protein
VEEEKKEKGMKEEGKCGLRRGRKGEMTEVENRENGGEGIQ